MAQPAKNLTVILAAVSTLGPFTIDAFFPALRAIAADLGVDKWQAQQLLTSFMVPYAVMSLVHGSVSDAVGRRRVILTGLALYTLASLVCMLAPGFLTLLVGRAMQGAVAGTGHIVARAIIRDRYSGPQAQRAMSTISMLFALGPAVAPVIGGWVHVWFGWRAVFGTMALFGVLMSVFMWLKLPETHPLEKRVPMHLGDITRSTARVLFNPRFLRLTAASGVCFVTLSAYIGSAPAIILDHWHMRETSFSALTIPVVGGFALGAFLSGRLAGLMAPDRQINLGFGVSVAIAAIMLAVQTAMPEPPILLQQVLLTLSATGMQLMFPVMTLRILDMFATARGAAASAHAFFSTMLSAIMMGLMAPWLSYSMTRLAVAALVVSVAGSLLWRWSLWSDRAAKGEESLA
jgi:DHA1 family bicyclomycin/chloramphenicol resistance-like MFS transporter